MRMVVGFSDLILFYDQKSESLIAGHKKMPLYNK